MVVTFGGQVEERRQVFPDGAVQDGVLRGARTVELDGRRRGGSPTSVSFSNAESARVYEYRVGHPAIPPGDRYPFHVLTRIFHKGLK